MKLTIADRLNFFLLYPEQSNILQQLLTKSIIEKVEISLEEAKTIELRQEENIVKWNAEKAKEKTVKFDGSEINFLKQQVKRLDEAGKITQALLPVCLAIQDYKEEK